MTPFAHLGVLYVNLTPTLMTTTKSRKAPGSTGLGCYFHIEISPSSEFDAFFTKDVGRLGHSLLVLGRRKKDGKWATHKWLINKNDAYITELGKLDSDDRRVKEILDYVSTDLVHKEKDVFYSPSHRSIRTFEKGPKNHSKKPNPEMYFESYEDYEKYQEERLSHPSCFE